MPGGYGPLRCERGPGKGLHRGSSPPARTPVLQGISPRTTRRRRGTKKRERNLRIGDGAWVYFPPRALLAVAPVLRRRFRQRHQKCESQSTGASSVRGARSRTSSRECPLPPDLGGSGRDHRMQGATLEYDGADRGAAAEGKTTEIAVVRETDDVTREASRRGPLLLHGRFRHDGLLRGSLLPPGYALDPSDPDTLRLLRADGTIAAIFSARGVTAEGILEAARQDSGRRTLRGILRRSIRRTA